MHFIEYTISDWESLLGSQVRRLRISQDLGQVELAAKANVSLGAIKNLESGKGSSIKTLILALRALHAEQWLAHLAPEPSVSPLQLQRGLSKDSPRSRVSRARTK